MALEATTSGFRFATYTSGASAYVYAGSNEGYVVGEKYHLIGTYDGNNVKLYVNGELKATTATTGTIVAPENNTVMAIGVNARGSSAFADYANIDVYNVRIYNKALTQEQVDINMNFEIGDGESLDYEAPEILLSSDVATDGLLREFDAYNNTGNGHNSSVTTWKDLTGTANGTLNGGTWSEQYLTLDGTDDWVNLGQINLTDAVTLEATIEVSEIQSGNAQILSNVQTGGVVLSLNNGYPRFSINIGGTNVHVTASEAITVGQKYHLTGKYDGQIAKLYVNGVLKAQTVIFGEIVQPSSNTVMAIGANPSGSSAGGNFFKGKVYAARIYDRAISKTAINHNIGVINNTKSITDNNRTWGWSNHNVTVKLADETGLAAGASVKYGWSLSKTTLPSKYGTAILEYEEGEKITTFTAVPNTNIMGKQYLWVIPETLSDTLGNTQTSSVISIEQFYLDRMPPDIVIGGDYETGLLRNYSAQNNTGYGHDNSATTWKDLSGNNDGILAGGTWTDEEYLTLDGVDDWVNLGYIAGLTNQVTLDATIEFITVSSSSTSRVIMGNWDTGGTGLYYINNKFAFNFYSNGAYHDLITDVNVVAGQKYRVTGTYDGNVAKIYIDGEVVKELEYTGTIGIPADSTVMALGVNPRGERYK